MEYWNYIDRRLTFYRELSDVQTLMLKAISENRRRVRFNLSEMVDAPMRRAIELYLAHIGYPLSKELYEVFEYDVLLVNAKEYSNEEVH